MPACQVESRAVNSTRKLAVRCRGSAGGWRQQAAFGARRARSRGASRARTCAPWQARQAVQAHHRRRHGRHAWHLGPPEWRALLLVVGVQSGCSCHVHRLQLLWAEPRLGVHARLVHARHAQPCTAQHACGWRHRTRAAAALSSASLDMPRPGCALGSRQLPAGDERRDAASSHAEVAQLAGRACAGGISQGATGALACLACPPGLPCWWCCW
jgi:hypothetical protein